MESKISNINTYSKINKLSEKINPTKKRRNDLNLRSSSSDRLSNNQFDDHSLKKQNFSYRTLNLGSLKMFFTIENNRLVYKFI